MRPGKKVLLTWLAVELAYLLSIFVFNISPVEWTSFANYSLQTLLAIISGSLALTEPVRKNRLIFLNFSALFGISFLSHFHVQGFVGSVIPGTLFYHDGAFAYMLLDQYIFRGAYFFLLAFAIVYLTMDALFRSMRAIPKYGLTLLIVGSFYAYYYAPFFEDPLYLHKTVAVQEWKGLDRLFSTFNDEHGRAPTEEELAGLAAAANWMPTSGPWLEKIDEYYPYLFGNNYQILVYKPLVMNQIYMSVLCIAFIFLFFGYQIVRDPPQGAYIEKVVFALLLFVSLEVYHSWMWLDSLNWPAFNAMYTIGQHVTIAVLLMIAGFFGLRLRFLNSANGEFYESELAMSPGSITRWRDVLDNMVIERFFNRRVLLGRLLVDPTRK
jgi:hypothetical protein